MNADHKLWIFVLRPALWLLLDFLAAWLVLEGCRFTLMHLDDHLPWQVIRVAISASISLPLLVGLLGIHLICIKTLPGLRR